MASAFMYDLLCFKMLIDHFTTKDPIDIVNSIIVDTKNIVNELKRNLTLHVFWLLVHQKLDLVFAGTVCYLQEQISDCTCPVHVCPWKSVVSFAYAYHAVFYFNPSSQSLSYLLFLWQH